jgi:DNA-binding NarL/FixJ family response regulator
MRRRSKDSIEKSKVSSKVLASILVVENQEVQARGLKSAFLSRGYNSVHYCFNAAEARAALANQSIDLVLINRKLAQEDGIALAIELRKSSAKMIIVILAADTPWSVAEEVQAGGLNALLSKSIPFPSLIDALEDLRKNPERFIFIGDRISIEPLDELTLSEREVLTALSSGLTTREIAKNRHNSEATIKSHLTSIYRKLGVRNRVEAIAHLYR